MEKILFMLFIAFISYSAFSQPGNQQYIPCGGTVLIGDCEYDGTPIEVTGAANFWNGGNFTDAIVVKNGASLIITGNVRLSKYIVVEPTGRLSIENATLTSLNDRWCGIYVLGNSSIPQSTYYGLHLTNATLKNAVTAVRVYGPTLCIPYTYEEDDTNYYTDQSEYNGGYVVAYNSRFEGNLAGVVFKEYNYLNRSNFIDCTFWWNGTGMVFNEVAGIIVDNCSFKNEFAEPHPDYKHDDIVMNNSFVKVEKSEFTIAHVPTQDNAIYITGTHPIIYDFDEFNNEIKDNIFHNFFNSIEMAGLSSLTAARIHGNTFKANAFFPLSDIYLNGTSSFEINGNKFISQAERAIICRNAANDGVADVYCNPSTIADVAVHADGWNESLQMWNNDWYVNDKALYVSGTSQNGQGSIGDQLENILAPNNCFSNNNAQDIVVTHNSPFNYYYKPGPNPCFEPAAGPGFTKKPIDNEVGDCIVQPSTPVVPPDVVVDKKIDSLCILKALVDRYPGNLQYLKAYWKYLIKYNIFIKPYIGYKMRLGDYIRVEQILKRACSLESKQKLFSLYLYLKSYRDAQSVLDELSRDVDVRARSFAQIEQIWLNWKMSGVKLPPDSLDIETLKTVANMDIPERGYARGILMTTAGIRLWDDDLIPLVPREDILLPSEEDKITSFTFSPNPAKGVFLINNNLPHQFSGRYEIIDMKGRIMAQEKMFSYGGESLQIDISTYSDGLYNVIIYDQEGKHIESIRLSVINK